MMQRLMKGKTKSCQTCGSFRTTPPCYNCTFNLDHPPPNYASLSRHDYCDDKVSPPGPTRLEHPLRGLPLMDLDPASSTAEYPMDETDFEVSRISQAVGRIGLAVAFLTDGRQTESATLPDSANNDTRSQNLSVPIQVPRSDEHTHFPRNCSAPELTSQASGDDWRERRLPEDHLLLLTTITSHVSDHQLAGSAPSTDLPRQESSPLPCQLLVPE